MTRIFPKFCLLVLLGACLDAGLGACLGAATPEPVKLDVVMVDYKFIPDHLISSMTCIIACTWKTTARKPTNSPHRRFLRTAKIDNPDILNHERSEIVVQPGETKDLFLTPGKPGTYDLRCADHDWDGMVGGITVQ